MFISASDSPSPVCREKKFHLSLLLNSLKQFVQQFSFTGGCLFCFYPGQTKPDQTIVWSELSLEGTLLKLETAIDWQHISTTQLFEVFEIAAHPFPTPYQLSGCLCRDTPTFSCYLLCWQESALSDHQRYGMTLYAQSLGQQFFQPSQTVENTPTQEVLQRTRHQLRTPLSLIALYVDLLKTAVMTPKSQEWLENLQTTVEQMHTSLQQLTDPTTFSENRLGQCDLRQLVQQCFQEMQPWIEAKQLTLVCETQPLWLWIDRWKMKQVLQNLLSNAIAFSPVRGELVCQWQVFQTEVLVKISDSGPGLSAEDLRALGTPFYSRRPGGTGLGLAIAKQIILAHQGNLWADNLPTGGAQFCFVLPRTT
ncbi:MAG: HAMP domain-containing histidine kinase [Scytolyngbya sp. HA4215-MV1]|jgi:signal transduction histidine kinase|nr:HAMP domain-containing histidine kinase [Scytolyngbya sp. HA4215-MV1]